jgi:hypothetical protein
MQINPLPWSHLLDKSVTCVVLNATNAALDQQILAAAPEVERIAIQHAIPKRQLEFARGRHCLRQAITLLGYPQTVMPIGTTRQPILPAGTLGSISHCEDYVVAAAAPIGDLIGLGIDVEKHQPLKPGIEPLILNDREQKHIHQLYAANRFATGLYWETLFFSIKESFYKALFAVHPFYVDFLEAEIQILDAQCFQIQPLIELNQLGRRPHIGGYAWDSSYIYCALGILD